MSAGMAIWRPSYIRSSYLHGKIKKLLAIAIMVLGFGKLVAVDVISIPLRNVCKQPYTSGAILRRDPLFISDFLTLHSLLRMAKPSSVFEIGTCTGEGTLIIKNAVKNSVVYSLELPPGESSYDIKEIGAMCTLPYTQIIGNSQSVAYSDFYPIDAWFIDGAHDYLHVFHETQQALLSEPCLIVWHDADIPEVLGAIKDGLDGSAYRLFRVAGTRIAFSIPYESKLTSVLYD